MSKESERKEHDNQIGKQVALFVFLVIVGGAFLFFYHTDSAVSYDSHEVLETPEQDSTSTSPPPKLDTIDYDKRLLVLANYPHVPQATTSSSTVVTNSTSSEVATTSDKLWPVKAPYPKYGALLPFNRIVAYYGNFYSKYMGVLGEYPDEILKEKLRAEMFRFLQADPSTPVIPAIHYIVSVAQESKGADGDYLLRMPDDHINHAITLARSMDGVTILDVQSALSDIVTEVNAVKEYFKEKDVHLGIDPEFAMNRSGKRPGTVIGTLDASEINQVIDILAESVRQYDLPPKILVIHRFTEGMVTNTDKIKLTPEVQVVMDADGWGSPTLKKAIYNHVIYQEPVQFAGIKLFYKNDLKKPSIRLLTPEELMELRPRPIYIQYQ